MISKNIGKQIYFMYLFVPHIRIILLIIESWSEKEKIHLQFLNVNIFIIRIFILLFIYNNILLYETNVHFKNRTVTIFFF